MKGSAIFTALLTLIGAATVVAAFPPSALASSNAGPVYVHMNGLNDFLPRVVFARPGERVVFVNEDAGAHSVHGYRLIGGKKLKDMDDAALAGMSGPDAKPHTYTVRFKKPGVHYYLCTVHAHLVDVYKTSGGEDYSLPAPRQGIPGYGGTMSGVVVVTREPALLDSNPPITHRRVLKKLWKNGDVGAQGSGS